MLVAVLCLYVCNEFCFLQLHYNEKDLYYKENRRHIKKNSIYTMFMFCIRLSVQMYQNLVKACQIKTFYKRKLDNIWYIELFLWWLWIWFMAFNATFINISVILWRSVLLVVETGVPRENLWPVASHCCYVKKCTIMFENDVTSIRNLLMNMELFQLAPVSAAYSVEKQQIELWLYGV